MEESVDNPDANIEPPPQTRCHDRDQKGVGLCLLSSFSLFLVSSSRTCQNVLR